MYTTIAITTTSEVCLNFSRLVFDASEAFKDESRARDNCECTLRERCVAWRQTNPMGRRYAAVLLLVAVLCATLGLGDISGVEASFLRGAIPSRPRGAFGRHWHGQWRRQLSSSPSTFAVRGSVVLRRVASVAAGRHPALLLALWPPFVVDAASHLRVDPGTGLIEELPEHEIAKDAVVFHTPVQHPGGQSPGW